MKVSIPYHQGARIRGALDRVLSHSERNDFAGFSKFDAMNSPLLEKTLGWSNFTRLFAVQVLNRVPLDLRTLTGVVKSRNPKGIGNFLRALGRLQEFEPDNLGRKRVEALANWLLENHSNRDGAYRGTCWGYNFAWQTPGFYAPRFYPNAIVTVFCAEGLLSAYRALGKGEYLDRAVDAARYLLGDLPVLEEDGDRKCLGYVTGPLNMKVININSVVGGFLARLAAHTGESSYLEESRKLINWTVGCKTGDNAWHYTHPPTVYVRNYDNYHTGGILDGILDYMEASGDRSHLDTYLRGLEFYRDELFEASGAPKWRNTRSFPHDIHGSAQGILTFAKAARTAPAFLDTAMRTAFWAIDHLQSPEGGFYYQKHRRFTWKLELMRWNNSWMAWALAELLYAEKDRGAAWGE